MAGIYIHIPYCRKACHYCNFHFSTSLKSEKKMIDAIGKEISLRKDYLDDEINTLYFGGGTPSILSANNLGYLLNSVNEKFTISTGAEITLEANPEDINHKSIKYYKEIGINRISLGVQSFDDNILKSLNRVHSKSQVIDAINIIQEEITNLTIDLIYGIPGQSFEMWKENLIQAVDMQIPHLACYALTIEEKTAFGEWLKKGKLKPVDDVRYEEDYNFMCSYLSDHGYDHYEVSNFAKLGMISKHNSSYWQQEKYLGLGPGAHSYDKKRRQFNVSNNSSYIKAINQGFLPYEEEELSQNQVYNEYLLTGLRTRKGIIFSEIEEKFNINLLEKKKGYLAKCVENGLAIFNNEGFILTDKGLLLADSIILELMTDDI